VWTIGYGHTGPDVVQGLIITKAFADELFMGDIRRFEIGVENALKRHATQRQFNALVSFAYNVGLGAFRSSTLLARFNAGDDEGAAAEFERWNKVGDKELPGLTRRRAAEAEHYRSA
jgi:lysozyme